MRLERQQHGAGDILDMDAREDLARLVDAARGAGLHLVDGAAAGPVDAGQAEDVDGRARLHAHRLPGALGRQALDAARLAGLGGCLLVDPAAAVIAVDAGGREIAQPARVAQHARRGLERGIACGAGGDGAEHVRRLAERRGRQGRRAVEQMRLEALLLQLVCLVAVRQVPATLQPAALASLAISRPL